MQTGSVTRRLNIKLAKFSKSWAKCSYSSFYLKSDILKKLPNIWATFLRKFDPNNFSKSLNLVTLNAEFILPKEKMAIDRIHFQFFLLL